MEQKSVQKFLETLGHVVSSADGDKASTFWQVPALVMSDEGAIPVSNLKEVADFFKKAAPRYYERGLVDTRPTILSTKELSRDLLLVEVRWANLDKHGAEKEAEESIYILRRDDDGGFKVQVAVSRHASEPVGN